MNSIEALKELEIATNWSSDEDIDKDLYNLWGNVACRTIKKDLDILEEHRKIEEELGIGLTVIFSALKYGVYYFDEQGQLIRDYVSLVNNYIGVGTPEKLSFSFLTYSTRQTLLFENYGKTWSVNKKVLKKKESKMKTLNNKEQNKLIEKIMELNSLIANSNVDLEAFDLLGDIMCSALEMRHTIRVKDALIEELKNKGIKNDI